MHPVAVFLSFALSCKSDMTNVITQLYDGTIAPFHTELQVEPRHAHGYANEILTPLQHTLQPCKAASSLPFISAGGLLRDTAIAAVCDGNADAGACGV
jgi:hypothetical protein